jgi:hypothetical protein
MYAERISDSIVVICKDCGCRFTMHFHDSDGLAHYSHHATCGKFPSCGGLTLKNPLTTIRDMAQRIFDEDMGFAVEI